MNTHKPAHKAKARHLCFVLLLYVPLVWGGVPGPCRYSVTKSHLVSLNRLIYNQLENGCPITYVFTQRQSLGEVCYIKAAFPQILELLNTQFKYDRKSDNERYVKALKKVIYDLYSQKCILGINEEIEDNPVKFVRMHNTSPREALMKALGVMEMYMTLINKSNGPIDWNCEEEYAEDYPEFTTAIPTPITDKPERQCSCPSVGALTPEVSLMPQKVWSSPPQASLPPPTSATPPRPPLPPMETHTSDREVFLGSLVTTTPQPPRRLQGTVPGGSSLGETIGSYLPAPLNTVAYPLSDRNNPSPHSLVLQGTTGTRDEMFDSAQTERTREASTVRPAGTEAAGSPKSLFPVPGVNDVTPIPSMYKVLGITPSSDKNNSAYLLAKSSLDARNSIIFHNGISTTTSQLEETRETHPGSEVNSRDWYHAVEGAPTEASPLLKMKEEEPNKQLPTTKIGSKH
ncbi:hypothetical protein UPYG_G00165970 [Umbra pygmaea]|uniref:Colony stimulating factor 1 n=1 Tax=Umbra pygmaea TaxID=75934 RepID=A0ABD0X4L1_UMBPY